MQYRAEIDGLRAIAVIPVVLFHAGYSTFSGGFVGVDVFFVISGYLITSIIIGDLANGEFSLARFYERRARRILPALFLVMICSIPFSWMWMMPEQYEDFTESLVATGLFVSNFLFWQESGYFAAVAQEKPLLHTWSLAVEEQYYVFFPVFALLLWRRGRRPLLFSIVVLAVVSFLLSEWFSRVAPNTNFFLAPTRMWEIFAGAVCAFLQFRQAQKSSNVISLAGLLLIVFAIFFFDEQTRFPSVYALVPVAGTALVILYGAEETMAARLLSVRALVGMGLVSYSAYLWHHPLFAFARLNSLHPPSDEYMAVLIVGAFALAYLSWRFVEKPFRSKNRISKKMLAYLIGPTLSTILLFGTISIFLPKNAGEYYRVGQDLARVDYQCRRVLGGCYFGDESGNSGLILLLGNSHARMLVPNLDAAFKGAGYIGFHPTAFNNDDLLVLDEYSERHIAKWRARICTLAQKAVVTVVSYRWTAAIASNPTGHGSENGAEVAERAQRIERFRSQLTHIGQCSKRMILVGPVPEAPVSVPKQLHLLRGGGEFDPVYTTSFINQVNRNSESTRLLVSISEKYSNIYYVNTLELMCSGNECPIYRNVDGQLLPLYYDRNHLSLLGSKDVIDAVMSIIR